MSIYVLETNMKLLKGKLVVSSLTFTQACGLQSLQDHPRVILLSLLATVLEDQSPNGKTTLYDEHHFFQQFTSVAWNASMMSNPMPEATAIPHVRVSHSLLLLLAYQRVILQVVRLAGLQLLVE